MKLSFQDQAHNLVRFLRNDIRMLLEMRCEKHGLPGDGPNFTLCGLALIGCEVGGLLTAVDQRAKGIRAARVFLGQVADRTGCDRYRTLAGPLFAFFRHGIAHSFFPLAHDPDTGPPIVAIASWSSSTTCWFESASEIDGLREGPDHLRIHYRQQPEQNEFSVMPQVLALDVFNELAQLEAALDEDGGDSHPLRPVIQSNLPRFGSEINNVASFNQLTSHERQLLATGNQKGGTSHG